MEKLNLYKSSNSLIGDVPALSTHNGIHRARNNIIRDNFTPRLLSYYENESFAENKPPTFYNHEPQLDLIYEDDEKYEGNGRSTGRNLPQKFHHPMLQTNYFDEDYTDYNQIVERHYKSKPHLRGSKPFENSQRQRSKFSSAVIRNRPNISLAKKRKYSKHSGMFNGNESQNNYDPWRDIYQQGVFENHVNHNHMNINTTPPSTIKPLSNRATNIEHSDKVGYKGYQVMASNVLYKTKTADESVIDANDGKGTSMGQNSNTDVSMNRIRKLSLEDEGQFAADFQQQHQNYRWGQAVGENSISQNRYPAQSTKQYNRRIYNRREPSLFGQKSGGVFQSPLLKTFSTTSRDSFYDYEDPLSGHYDDMEDYMMEDKDTKGSIRDGVIEKVAHVLDYDYYGDGSNYGMHMKPSNSASGMGLADTITRRISDAVFSPITFTVLGVLALPLILAAAYWLFVVNGPTPVVKARIDDLLGIKTEGGGNVSEASLGLNNFVEGDVTYTEVAPLWDAIGKPLLNRFMTFLQTVGSVSPTSSSDTGGFYNKEPLFSGILENNFF